LRSMQNTNTSDTTNMIFPFEERFWKARVKNLKNDISYGSFFYNVPSRFLVPGLFTLQSFLESYMAIKVFYLFLVIYRQLNLTCHKTNSVLKR
jgi:hypothetical protein